MCFHSKQTKKAVELEHRFNAKVDHLDAFHTSAHYHGFEFPQTPVITDKATGIITHYQWGMIPSWAKDTDIQKYTLNAKIETVHEKPSFKNSVNKRCLVLADGFYEWQWLTKSGSRKQKYLITTPEEEAFAYAGLWSEWVDKSTGEVINTYTLLTTEANTLMAEIHNNKKRMPVILRKEDETKWLQHDSIDLYKYPYEVELKATAI